MGKPCAPATSLIVTECLESRTLLAGNFGYATVFKPTSSVGSPAGGGNAIAVDAAGNTYVTGSFVGTYDLGAGPTASAGAKDLFVTKLTPQGGTAWVRVIGSTGDDSGQGITLDSAGNVYLTGFFSGTVDANPGAGTFNLVSAGATDSFVLKLDNNGNFVNAMRLGGTGADQGMAIAVDPVNGEIVTTGFFNGTVNAGNGTPDVTSNGGEDVFVSIIANSNLVNQSFYKMGGTTNDRGFGLAIEPGRDVYVTGTFTGTADFDPTSGTFNLVSAGLEDAFVARLDGSIVVWATRTGSAGVDAGRGIAIDPDGNVLSTGRFALTVDFNPGSGTFNLISAGGSDGYVLKQDDAGNFIYARPMGGIGGDDGAVSRLTQTASHTSRVLFSRLRSSGPKSTRPG